MKFLFLLLGFTLGSTSFADNLTSSGFTVNSNFNSCNNGECISHLVVTYNDIQHVTDHPQILNSDIKVLTNECEGNKCDLMIRSSKKHETINILIQKNKSAEILNYSLEEPAYYL